MSLRTLADHLMDICQNSIKAGGKRITLSIEETDEKFYFKVIDDAGGMDTEIQKIVFDPFYTSRNKKIRKVGLGLPFLKNATELTGGYVSLKSEMGVGTIVEALFKKGHIDCQPVGDIPNSLFALLSSSAEVDWIVNRKLNSEEYSIDTQALFSGKNKDDIFSNPSFLAILKESLCEMENSILQ